ncbi:hypothetical protein BKA67DRAFT_586182, partial [Truncatella angustata]
FLLLSRVLTWHWLTPVAGDSFKNRLPLVFLMPSCKLHYLGPGAWINVPHDFPVANPVHYLSSPSSPSYPLFIRPIRHLLFARLTDLVPLPLK